jgi:hypothetical protein
VSGRDSMQNFAGARAKLATATQDLFRLSGSHSIPVEATAASEAPAPSVPEPVSSARKPEASMMFSLEALMKANQAAPEPGNVLDEASNQLWSMQAATPLFGTSHDQALLTTPLKMEPAQSMDSMTLPSQAPSGRRWWPILLAASAGLALAGAGIYVFGAPHAAAPIGAVTPSSEHAALVAQLPAPAGLALPASPAEPAEGRVEATAPGALSAAASEPAAADPAAPAAAVSPAAAPGASDTSAAPAKDPVPAVSSTKAPAKDKADTKKAAPRIVAALPSPKAAAAFDKGAAKTALNEAASAAARCGAGGAPGKGKIQVTFTPSGKVSDAQLVEGPFAGTTAGKCALRHFRAVKVPAFSGAAVTVAKSFKVD